jgi:hypothetical protein
MCDAVQEETYQVDGIACPQLPPSRSTTASDEQGGRNDFLGTVSGGKTLRSFGINPGGYIGFFNPATNDHDTVALAGDAKAARRLEIKSKYRKSRRSFRYQHPGAEPTPPAHRAARAAATRETAPDERRQAPAGKIDVLRRTPIDKQRPDTD